MGVQLCVDCGLKNSKPGLVFKWQSVQSRLWGKEFAGFLLRQLQPFLQVHGGVFPAVSAPLDLQAATQSG